MFLSIFCCFRCIGWVQAITRTSEGFASASFDETIRLWKMDVPPRDDARGFGVECSLLHIFEGHSNGVWCLKWVPAINVLVSGASDTTVRIWSLDSRHRGCVRVLEGHTGDVYSVDADVHITYQRVEPPSNDGTVTIEERALLTVVSGSADETVRLVKLESTRLHSFAREQLTN